MMMMMIIIIIFFVIVTLMTTTAIDAARRLAMGERPRVSSPSPASASRRSHSLWPTAAPFSFRFSGHSPFSAAADWRSAAAGEAPPIGALPSRPASSF